MQSPRIASFNRTSRAGPVEEDEKIHHERTTEEFLEACEALTEVEDRHTFFHNLRGFDGNFILEALYDQGRPVERP